MMDSSALSDRRSDRARWSSFMHALESRDPVRAVELRPPPVDLDSAGSLDAWIDLERGVRRLLSDGRFVLFTDDAVGDREEESLRVLTSSLGPHADLSRVIPFLTCKHSFEYCDLFARRSRAHGLGGITVTGGDLDVGPPRCVPRSRDLRASLAERTPTLPLGAWVNPYREAAEQVDLLLEAEHHADFFLTQVVSHHELAPVDRFLEEVDRRELEVPGLFGVFYYRSARRRTLDRLSDFFPVPVPELEQEFEAGAGPDEICARTIRALASRGIEKVYLSNLAASDAAAALHRIEALL